MPGRGRTLWHEIARALKREMAGRLSVKFQGSPTLRKIGMNLYASHGGRSAPRQVA